MAWSRRRYSRYGRRYRRRRNYSSRGFWGFFGRRKKKKKSKYSKTEKLAFEIGQRQRIRDDIARSHDSRVYESFSKGYAGIENKPKEKKTLFSK